jgi:hypothetical protein
MTIVLALVALGLQAPTHDLVREHVVAEHLEPVTQAHAMGGRIVVGHLRPYLTEITAAGEVRSVGRAGDGPGELRSARYVGLLGDTIWVGDSQRRRMTIFPPAGQPHVYTPAVADATFSPRAYLGGGVVLGTAAPVSGGGGAGQLMAVGDAGAVSIAPIGNPAYMMVQFGSRLEDGAIQLLHPFADGTLFGVDPVRRRVVVLNRSVADRYTVTWFDASGTQLLRRVYPVPAQRVTRDFTDRLNEQYREQHASRFPNVPRSTFERAFRDAIGTPAHVPPANEIIVAATGELWVEGALQPPGSPSNWTVISPAGEITATFELPAGLRLVAAEGATAFVLEDSMHLVRYRLQPLPPR